MRILFIILLFTVSSLAYADDPHHEYDGNITITNIHEEDSSGVALSMSMAAQQFDFGTYSLQGSIGAAEYRDNKAISFGVGKRFGKNRALFNGSIGIEEGHIGVAGAVNWRF